MDQSDDRAKADRLGRGLQDARLPAARTARIGQSSSASPTRPKRSAPVGDAVEQLRATLDKLEIPGRGIEKPLQSIEAERDWITKSGFTSSDALARLINPLTPFSKKER